MVSGSSPPEHVRNEESTPENGGNNSEENSEVGNLEEASNKYYNELIQELFDMRQKVGEEKTLNRLLTSTKASLIGRIESYLQRIDELGVEELETIMEKAKEEIEATKLEIYDLDQALLTTGLESLHIVGVETNQFEDIRLEFKNDESISRHSSLEDDLRSQLENKMLNVKEKLKKTNNAAEDLELTLESFEKADQIIAALDADIETTNQEIHVLGYQLVDLEKE